VETLFPLDRSCTFESKPPKWREHFRLIIPIVDDILKFCFERSIFSVHQFFLLYHSLFFFLGFWLGYLGILSCVLRGALRFFDMHNITYPKKKKKSCSRRTPYTKCVLVFCTSFFFFFFLRILTIFNGKPNKMG
jgi:hypothetical protein